MMRRPSRMARLSRYTALPLASLALTLSTCDRSGPGPAAPAPSGSAAPASGGSAVPAPSGPAVPSFRPSDCVASQEEATVRADEQPGPICVIVGAALRVTSQPSADRPWQPLSTSDASTLTCASSPGPNGTIEAMCRALRPGVVTLSTRAERDWTLTVVVLA